MNWQDFEQKWGHLRNRKGIPHLLGELGMTGIGVEVGVLAGDFSKNLLLHSKLSLVVSVDPWKRLSGYRDYREKNSLDWEVLYQRVVLRLKPFGARSRICRKLSTEAAAEFVSGSLDFVYIDADHQYVPCLQDINIWWPKIRVGGLISGHDYRNGRACQVLEAVKAFSQSKALKVFKTREGNPSWGIVKLK
jgi:hypothetical protein